MPIEQIDSIGCDRSCRIGGERPLLARKVVACMRGSDRVRRLIGEKFRRQPVVERQQQTLRRRQRGVRMVHDDQVVRGREVGHRGIGKRLQRPLLPANRDFRMQLLETLRRGNHRQKAAGVVPGDAA